MSAANAEPLSCFLPRISPTTSEKLSRPPGWRIALIIPLPRLSCLHPRLHFPAYHTSHTLPFAPAEQIDCWPLTLLPLAPIRPPSAHSSSIRSPKYCTAVLCESLVCQASLFLTLRACQVDFVLDNAHATSCLQHPHLILPLIPRIPLLLCHIGRLQSVESASAR